MTQYYINSDNCGYASVSALVLPIFLTSCLRILPNSLYIQLKINKQLEILTYLLYIPFSCLYLYWSFFLECHSASLFSQHCFLHQTRPKTLPNSPVPLPCQMGSDRKQSCLEGYVRAGSPETFSLTIVTMNEVEDRGSGPTGKFR